MYNHHQVGHAQSGHERAIGLDEAVGDVQEQNLAGRGSNTSRPIWQA